MATESIMEHAMTGSWSRPDIEGTLLVTSGSSSRLVKRLALDVAWHMLDPEDLEYLLPAWIEEVDVDHGRGVVDLRYVAGLEPMNTAALRKAVAPERRGWEWRLAVVLLELARDLAAFHDVEVTQGVVHPDRVVRRAEGFGLLPTLAGTLAPLSKIPGNEVGGWLHYIAPEVLRTRCNEAALLAAGDVYALGRLALVVSSVDFEHDMTSPTLTIIDRRIEGRSVAEIGDERTSNTTRLAVRMCAHNPEERPELQEVIAGLERIVRDASPGETVRALLRNQGADDAESYLAAVLEGSLHPALDLPLIERYRLEADIALARKPPNIVRALDRIGKAVREDPGCWQLHRRLGSLYLQHVQHPQHVALAAASYERAAKISDWDPEVTDTWAELLGRSASPAEAFEELGVLPWEVRTPHVHARRMRSLIGMGEAEIAWQEAARWIDNCDASPLMEAVLLEIVVQLDPQWLMEWTMESQSIPHLMETVIESNLG